MKVDTMMLYDNNTTTATTQFTTDYHSGSLTKSWSNPNTAVGGGGESNNNMDEENSSSSSADEDDYSAGYHRIRDDDDDDHRERNNSYRASKRFAKFKHKVSFLESDLHMKTNRTSNFNGVGVVGVGGGIMRSLSLSNATDSVNNGDDDPSDTRNIRERFGRTRRRQPKSSHKCSFKKHELIAIISLGMVDFIGFCSMSVMAPFFPAEAAKKGMNVSHAGYVFSFYALVMFLTSPLFGKTLPYIGTKFMFISGVFVTAVCNILFGFLPAIQSNTQFSIFCFIVRGMEAIGAGAFSTASFIYVIHMFPDNISAVLGIMETFAGLGMSIGPALGGFLYSENDLKLFFYAVLLFLITFELNDIGGFELPFFVLGVVMLALLPFYYILLEPMYGNRSIKHPGSLFRIFKIPSVFIIFLIIVVTSNAWSFLDPTLEPHLRTLNLKSHHMGLVFLAFSAVYAICSPIWGYFGDKHNNHWSMMAVGLVVTAFALVLLGPSPIIPHATNTLWLNMLALCILAASVALTLAPTYKAIIECAIAKGFEDNLSTYSIVAGIWSSAYSLGDMTGPSLGGILLEKFNFPVTTTAMAILALLTAAICVLYFGIIDDYPKNSEYTTLHPMLMKDKLAYYGALSSSSDAVTITLTNSGACEV